VSGVSDQRRGWKSGCKMTTVPLEEAQAILPELIAHLHRVSFW